MDDDTGNPTTAVARVGHKPRLPKAAGITPPVPVASPTGTVTDAPSSSSTMVADPRRGETPSSGAALPPSGSAAAPPFREEKVGEQTEKEAGERQAGTAAEVPEGEPLPEAGRPGDTGVGRRRMTPPSPEQLAERPVLSEAGGADRVDREAAEALAAAWPVKGSSATVKWLIAVVAALVVVAAFFLYVQLVSAVTELLRAPAWLRWPGLAGLGVLVAAAAGAGIRVWWFWRSLRRNEPVSWVKVGATGGLEGAKALDAAEKTLCAHLKSYDRLLAPGDVTLSGLGLAVEGRERMVAARGRLLDDLPLPAEQWMRVYSRDFLSELDRAVDARIARRAWMVAYQSVLLPRAGLDVVITLYHSARLLEETARIYNQRLDRRGTLATLARIVLTAGAAGAMQPLTEGGADLAADLWPEVGAAGVLGQGVNKLLGAKAAEGTVNYFIVRRLGRRIKQALRPMQPD